MFDNQTFQQLVEADQLTGEVVGTNGFIVEVKGLEGVRLGAQVLFEDGQRCLVRQAHGDKVVLFNLDSESIDLGTLAVVQAEELQVPVGEGMVGRVVNPLGVPLDEKGPINFSGTSSLFNAAPGIMDREPLKDYLPTGVAFVDMFFPVVLGQRIAVLGDSKAGKTTFLTQMTQNQADTGRLVVYVLIGKRRVDIENLVGKLNETGAINHTIIVVANIFDSLTQTYLAPYAGCSIAEHLWRSGKDVVIVYDDLSAHAEAYRQLSLLEEVDPGRDSYPGDMFYAHSSLLERAGKLLDGGHTLTSLPVVVTPNNDVTAYLSTNIMSITDGQIIFDLELFRQDIRPAVNSGLSVSRVGGNAQTKRQKLLTGSLVKKLAQYHQAEEFSHFGSSLSQEASLDLALGKNIFATLHQGPNEIFSIIEQQLMLETIMKTEGKRKVDMPGLKTAVKQVGTQVKEEADLDRIEAELYEKYTALPVQPKPPEPAPPPVDPKAKKDKEKQHATR
jgi:F-type H+-transporting ATPase subunit alpha